MIPNQERKIAYFSMEIGIDAKIPTYSGGLGVLAGDTLKSCADLKVPLVAVTLLYEKGYFYQKLDEQGNQKELPVEWNPKDFLKPLPKKVTVQIENRNVAVCGWQYDVRGITGYSVPIIFLDTDIEENSPYDRSLNDFLYGGDQRYRLAQEVVLGIGGVRMLDELGYTGIKKYHMNEGHASLLTLELLSRMNGDSDAVRQLCIFTTHTPVPAGHDQFPYELVKSVLGDFISLETLKRYAGLDKLNMTLLALNLSKYINGVAKRHGEVSREMFPGYPIDSITNGIHSYTWTHSSFKGLYDRYIPGWAQDPFSLRYAISIPQEEIWQAHLEAKKELIDYVNREANSGLDYETFTVGFARRATLYKRMDLVFSDINRLRSICEKRGKIQFIFSGKSHPQDWQGKELIRKVFEFSRQLKDKMKIVYLENYDMDIAKALVSGVDLWLNTPKRPNEASGTSGMKAAHNGVPSLSVLDGWWIEGCIEGITGWSIGLKAVNDDQQDAEDLYRKLEEIISIFYKDRDSWIQVMRSTISFNASFFNTHRMVQQYGLNAYLD
ncbi:MAG: alpha-glucan family phosphorylase [Candidatus Omnitrophota bacterium]|nr:alpha-glucan family phosphorylase [Candidatus Omnitrophota bacterium]